MESIRQGCNIQLGDRSVEVHGDTITIKTYFQYPQSKIWNLPDHVVMDEFLLVESATPQTVQVATKKLGVLLKSQEVAINGPTKIWLGNTQDLRQPYARKMNKQAFSRWEIEISGVDATKTSLRLGGVLSDSGNLISDKNKTICEKNIALEGASSMAGEANAAVETLPTTRPTTRPSAAPVTEEPITENNSQVTNTMDSKQFELVNIETNFGEILIWLYDATPKHKANFLKLTKEGFYDGLIFHRVIDDFMIQGGDPQGTGIGGPGYNVDAEFVPELTHKQGAVAAARKGDAVNPKRQSSGSQFYIVENPKGTHFLDRNYTVFGQTIKGIDVVEAIASTPKSARDKPLNDVVMEKVSVVMYDAETLKSEFGFEVPK